MKVHDEIESLTDLYLAGGLEGDERRDVEEHAASCDACARILRDAKEFHGWVKGSSAAGAPPTGLEDRIIANLRAATPGARRWPKAPRAVKWLAGLAAIFVFMIIGTLFSQSDELALVQNKLVVKSGVDSAAGWTSVPQERGPRDGAVFEGGEVAGKEEFRRELHRNPDYLFGATAQSKSEEMSTSVESFASAIGGDAARRVRDSLKNYGQDKAPAPATAAPEPMPDAEKMDHDESENRAQTRRFAGEEERKDLDRGEGTLGKLINDPPSKTPPEIDDRKIIRNADLHLEVEVYETAYKSIGDITREKKGYIAGASTTKLANGKIRATVTLRIPPEKFEETLADLGRLGLVRHQAISTSDVTKQYQDLASRLKSKETLVERLKKVLLEGKGTVKELMEVEVQMGATIEQIEAIKGELKYYDNLVGMSTITMQVFEKDMGLPFEYVQTLQSVIAVTDFDADARYAAAQKAILDAGGQVAESRMNRANNDSATGFVRGKVDAEKFPAVRDALKKLGRVDQDTVNQQQTGRGGKGDAKPGAAVRKEQAVIDFTVNTPPIVTTRRAMIAVEASPAETAYQQARKEVESAKGEILGGSLTDKTGGAAAFVRARIDAKEFPGLVEKLKGLGKVKSATVKQDEPGVESGEPRLLREKGEILIEIATPAPLIPEESGLGRVLRDTFSRSVAGVLWSVEKLFVGIALAGPWIVLAIVVILVWRRARRRAKPNAA